MYLIAIDTFLEAIVHAGYVCLAYFFLTILQVRVEP